MRWIAGVLLWGMALAQSLAVSPEAQVGQTLEIRGADFPPGRYTLKIASEAATTEVDLETFNGSLATTWTPPAEGTYKISIQVGERVIQAETQVRSAPPPTPPAAQSTTPAQPPKALPTFTPEGLVLGSWKLPLKGEWVGPRVLGQRAFIARGPLVLEIDLQSPKVVAQHYPPGEVRALEADAELTVLLEDGRRLGLGAFAGKPYEGRWESLAVIREYLDTLKATSTGALDQSPSSNRPYWYFFSLGVDNVHPTDLESIGRDLLQRGHRPELAWGPGVMRWLEPWLMQVRVARKQGIEQSLLWSDFFLKYLPQVPGAKAMLWEQVGWLEAQGRPDLGQRYRAALRQVAGWQSPLTSANMAAATWVLLGLYSLMLLYLALIYLPAQLRGLRSSGGWLVGWFQHPLLRLRHSVLAYTTIGERSILLVLFALAALALLSWGFMARSEALLAQDSLMRGTLRSSAAAEALRGFANTAPLRGLLAYALAKENPGESQRLFQEAPPWTYVLLGRGTPEALAQAYQRAPSLAAVREALGLGGDFWTPVYRDAGVVREAVPTPRIIVASVGLSSLQGLGSDFFATWRDLPIWPSAFWAWTVAAAILVFTLYHMLCFFLPKPQSTTDNLAWRRTVQLLFPGSPIYNQGWGLLVLLAFAGGLWLWRQDNGWGVVLAGAALSMHLLLWVLLVYRGGKTA
ncbi:MAG: hypothetical protein KatS3mg070_1753 [Meiothermus sp.]|uniref:hypothetical protein n=1 Tax=Meiothermus sp. TaxID=1955249 RepID=UPI0021DEA4FC|nr:hypothetical protein [Meiothermus sp.]GIW28390.1 MAG: hypothetical protein KatS3mg070_1753 [Meiothermus sp.]